MKRPITVIIEKHADGFVAYPVGLKGIVVAEGDTYNQALDEVQSAIRFHIDTFGSEAFDGDHMAEDVFIAEAAVVV